MTGYVFDFESGDLSLDFANTKAWHASKTPTEHMANYADYISWGEQAGLVSSESASRLRRLEDERPGSTSAFFDRAIQLREAIYNIFSSRYAGKPVPEADLAVLNTVVQDAMSHLQLTSVDEGFGWSWVPEINGANIILWSAARAAAELLTSDKAGLVRECEDDRGCGYLFIDQSKNHSRRWCSMDSCGNRAKARRHYQRVR